MKYEHTPGPWLADLEIYPVMVRSQSETWPLVDELGNEEGRAGVFVCNTGDNKANARLIAAAPELLEALEKALWGLEYHTAQTGSLRLTNGAMQVARAAIAKATGGCSMSTQHTQPIPQAVTQIPQEHSSNESAYQRGYLDGMAKRPQPLTDEQIANCISGIFAERNYWVKFARAIEAAHDIRCASSRAAAEIGKTQ